MLLRLLNKLYNILCQTAFPPKCLVCGRFFQPADTALSHTGTDFDAKPGVCDLYHQTQLDRLLSPFLCPVCLRGVVLVESPICLCCGWPFYSWQGPDHRCGECITSPKKFRIARAPLVYDQTLMAVIHCFKYKGKIQLAGPLSELLLTAFNFFWDKDSIDVIVPVPLHLKRFRQRGFNQAYLLIQKWQTIAAVCDVDVSDLRIERDLLLRTMPTAPQTALGRRQRAANIKNAFDVCDEEKIKDKRVLLVDDVYTTGATADECARWLLSYGAKHVDVLTLARAI